MEYIEYTRRKVLSVLNEIENLSTSDFPHSDGEEALNLLKALFERDLERLNKLRDTKNTKLIIEACSLSNSHIVRFHFILGFILRSTNVRNSFEFFDPVLRLGRCLLGDQAKLILSSEWNFSPFTYPLVFSDLPNFVLIGLPASESGNALVIPLAGHELGHSVWRQSGVGTEIEKLVEAEIVNQYRTNFEQYKKLFDIDVPAENIQNDLDSRSIWMLSYRLSKRQCEEIFCDFIGTRIFGISYLRAFMYLLAPNLGGRRSENYPSLADRGKYIREALKKYRLGKFDSFENNFRESSRTYDQKGAFQLRMSDMASNSLVPVLMAKADEIFTAANVIESSNSESEKIAESFSNGVPYDGALCLADVINAGWSVYGNVVAERHSLDDELGQFRSLNAMLFKTIEIMEFRERTRQE